MLIVRLALRRPYTFVFMAMAIVLLGLVAIVRMPTDIFPEVDIPVISVVWQYPGMSPSEMEGRMVRPFEGFLTTTVNDIEHIEANSYAGIAVVKVFFQPGVNVAVANAQGIALDYDERWAAITGLLEKAVGGKASMLQDVEAGRSIELDAIVLPVVEDEQPAQDAHLGRGEPHAVGTGP